MVTEGQAIDERISEGHQMLVQIVGEDYGYDLQRWHDHLKETGEGGYTWRRNIDLPKVMKEALASTEWQDAVARLENTQEKEVHS